ncbi:hypothetical protein C8R44DRAFT_727452 [Mycena epipterygia]|nr:hypothetical protein C8R44DRAFT_727452 [Mycena epipterygia]
MSSDETSFLEEMRALRTRGSGTTNPRKRSRLASTTGGSDDENAPSTPLPELLSTGNVLVSRNVATAVKTYAKKQKLRGDQETQLDTFLTDSQTVHDAKIFIGLLAVQNDLQKIIATKPPYAVSAELKVNIQGYVIPVLLSPKLGSYKGDLPVQHVFNIIKKHRFDTPPGFEHNPAERGKIIVIIQDAFTQGCSKLKKLLSASVKILQGKKAVDLPREKHQNLFGLAQSFVDGSKCCINGGLCGCITLMRKIFLKYPGPTFWDELDRRLVLMREAAAEDPDPDAIVDMFDGLIDDDKINHGNIDIVYEGTDDIQEEVDATIAATVIDAAITVGPDADTDASGASGGDPPVVLDAGGADAAGMAA